MLGSNPSAESGTKTDVRGRAIRPLYFRLTTVRPGGRDSYESDKSTFRSHSLQLAPDLPKGVTSSVTFKRQSMRSV